MVRKIKVSDVIDSQPATGEEEATMTTTQEPTIPEPEEREVEKNPEPPAGATVDSVDSTAAEPPTPKPKRPPRKKKDKEPTEAKTTETPPPIDEVSPPTPETEHPAEEIQIAPPKAKAKPRAKPKAKQVQTQQFPTHDDEGQRLRPPPSMERPTRPETPEEFWSNTLKNMKEKKDRQYASLIQSAF